MNSECDEDNKASDDCLSDPIDDEDEPSDEDTDELSDESGAYDVCSCDETVFVFINSRTIPEEYKKEYKQLVKTSFTRYDKAYFKKQQKIIRDWSYQMPILESPYTMYFHETINVKRLFYLLDEHDVNYTNCKDHLAYLNERVYIDKQMKDILCGIYNADWRGSCISRSRKRFKEIVLQKHRAWLNTKAGTFYKYKKAVVYWENELGMKWDDDRIDRDNVSVAKEHVMENCSLAEFLIEMKDKDTVNGHWRQFLKWLRQEENIVSMNQLKERISNDEKEFFISAGIAGYLDADNVHGFKVEVYNYEYDEEL